MTSAISNETLLDMFRNYWNANMGGIPRDLAHLLTGRVQGGNIIGKTKIISNTTRSHWLLITSYRVKANTVPRATCKQAPKVRYCTKCTILP